jgi:Protein of unknown function (DUF3040)
MSTSEHERQALDSIESELAHSAPRLTSMVVMFSRLTADEQMPAREPVRSVAGRRRGWRCRIGRRTRGWLCLAAAAALLALMTLTHGTQVSVCAHSLTTACERVRADPYLSAGDFHGGGDGLWRGECGHDNSPLVLDVICCHASTIGASPDTRLPCR